VCDVHPLERQLLPAVRAGGNWLSSAWQPSPEFQQSWLETGAGKVIVPDRQAVPDGSHRRWNDEDLVQSLDPARPSERLEGFGRDILSAAGRMGKHILYAVIVGAVGLAIRLLPRFSRIQRPGRAILDQLFCSEAQKPISIFLPVVIQLQ
jgi:hypothetical protein